jgi:hypothetical protein
MRLSLNLLIYIIVEIFSSWGQGVENPAPFEGADESACLEAQERKTKQQDT